LAGWAGIVQKLTPTNALVVFLLVVSLVPAFTAYRLLTDPQLLDRFLSSYSVSDPLGACRVVKARQRGEDFSYAITTGVAFEGQQRWTIGTVMTREPTTEEVTSNCALLQAIIDFMHGATAAPPDIIWQYRDIDGREGMKGDR
jgi:hypothetical protein